MQQVIICNRFGFPDNSATSQLLSDLATHLAKTQASVTIIAGRHSYVKNTNKLASEIIWEGVRIRRVWSTNFGRNKVVGRSLDLISFMVFLYLELNRCARRGDIVIAKTDPPLLSVVCAMVTRRRKARLVNWLQDLYPDLAVAFGMLSASSVIVRSLSIMRNWSLKSAYANVVISKSMGARIAADGITKHTIVEIPNWTNDSRLQPLGSKFNDLRELWGLRENFVIGYSGNLGRAHEYQTIIDAAAILQHQTRIKFLMIGGGSGQDRLQAEILKRGLTKSFIFKPYQKDHDLCLSLSSADVHWISLKPECEGLVFPSKMYGIAAVGRPIVVIGSSAGDLACIVRHYNCGHTFAPGEAFELSQYLLDLESNVELRHSLGTNARFMIDSAYSRDLALGRWVSLIDNLSNRTDDVCR